MMLFGKTRTVGVDGKHCAHARSACGNCCPIKGAAQQNQSRKRECPVAVGCSGSNRGCEIIHDSKAAWVIGVYGIYRAAAGQAALLRRPIQGSAREDHFGNGEDAVGVDRVSDVEWGGEVMQNPAAGAIGGDGKKRAVVISATKPGLPVKVVAS